MTCGEQACAADRSLGVQRKYMYVAVFVSTVELRNTENVDTVVVNRNLGRAGIAHHFLLSRVSN